MKQSTVSYSALNASRLMVLILALILVVTLTACKAKAFAVQLPPYLPAECYTCLEATPGELVGSYFSGYANASWAEVQYNNSYFVFKNIPVKDWVLADLDKGFIWIGSGIKCELANPHDMDRFKLEDKIDVVGLNTGVISYKTPGLLFKNCYVIPAGAVQLPAVGGGGFSAGY
jgi:hypothetical protein